MNLTWLLWKFVIYTKTKSLLLFALIELKSPTINASECVVNAQLALRKMWLKLKEVYSAAKGGVIAFSKTLAREMAKYKINVNVVCPGPANTPLFKGISKDNPKLSAALEKAIPFRRLAEPTDIANAVCFFVSDEASYITGQTLSVSGGLTMV